MGNCPKLQGKTQETSAFVACCSSSARIAWFNSDVTISRLQYRSSARYMNYFVSHSQEPRLGAFGQVGQMLDLLARAG